jgi:ketosteroid isomerase-like protein
MRNPLFYLLPLLSVVVMLACNEPAHSNQEMVQAARELDIRFIKCLNNKDLEGVMACYWKSPELVMYAPGQLELRGYDAVKESYAKFFAAPGNVSHEVYDTHYRMYGGNAIVGRGRVRLTIPATDSTGTPMVIEGRYTETIEYKDGQWVYVLDHASVPLPNAEAPKEEASGK